ncbi:probable glycosyltransferase At5g03795 [Durio zibethinus]|uniref:Probable glycosyltransferase At5g03795 n=1 Tax=Durio zibethinus TaxID=66656 RepID=A0A6P6AQM6_DURZI|nr:probable glycosyltransferase At5g03795 [Durio zibethinus]
MGVGLKTWFSTTFSSSSSSSKILLFVVPLILVTGFASLLVLKGSGWVFIYSHPFSKPSLDIATSQAKQRDGLADLRLEVLAVDDHSRKEALSNETAINNSVSSPISAEPLQVQDSLIDDHPLKPRRRRFWTNLDRLEAGLQRARVAIKEAINGSRLQDPDYSPDGPIYRNAKVFHRSYLEMEKQFKIFVYNEGELPLFHDGPCRMLYTIEGQFINKMEMNKKFRALNPEKAHVFFLPYSITRMRHFVNDLKSFGRIVLDYVNVIAAKHPYWNRSLGADHFMLACHDWGPHTSFYVPELVKFSIRALCNANTSEKFNPWKDVSVPEINLKNNKLEGLIGGPSPSKRSILAFFAGGNHGPVRPILFEHWGKKDPDIQVHDYLPGGVSYYDLMRQSKYCLCPSGYEVASPRVVESLYNGCVPVLISKSYVPPFSDVLNWKMFSVIVSLEDIPNLKKILMSIPERKYIRMQKRVVKVRRHFELNSPPKRFDVFHMILHSIWIRRLNVRINDGLGKISN